MSIVAWDGVTLAADKRSVCVGLPSRVTKIVRLHDGRFLGVTGRLSALPEVAAWLNSGALPAAMPSREDTWTALVIDRELRIWMYEGPLPFHVEEAQMALGSGRDYALMAMHLGKTAPQAIALTSIFDVNCGDGIDTLTFEGA